jgi:hypothetical protein
VGVASSEKFILHFIEISDEIFPFTAYFLIGWEVKRRK